MFKEKIKCELRQERRDKWSVSRRGGVWRHALEDWKVDEEKFENVRHHYQWDQLPRKSYGLWVGDKVIGFSAAFLFIASHSVPPNAAASASASIFFHFSSSPLLSPLSPTMSASVTVSHVSNF